MPRDPRTPPSRARRATLAALAVATLGLVTFQPSTAQAVPTTSGVWSAPTPTPTPSATPVADDAGADSVPATSPFPDTVGGAKLGVPNTVVVDPAAPKPPPKVDVASYVLADLDTGEILAAKNAHQKLPPASTLKTLTALTLLPRVDKRARYEAVRGDADVIGSKVGIEAGRVYTIDQLFYGLFLPSGNDAAHALANANGGMAATVRLMNDEAHRLGAFDTHAVNTSGLDEPGQVSSAYDLALFARAGMAMPDFARYVSTLRYDFPGRNGKTYQIQTNNDLLTEYPGAIGVKNGYTTKARNTLIGAAERNGRKLVVALMRTDAPSHEKAAALLDWGFSVADEVEPVGTLVTAEMVADAVAAQLAATATPGPVDSPAATDDASSAPANPGGDANAAPPMAPQSAHVPEDLQRMPIWIWLVGAVFIVLAGLRVVTYVRSRRRGDGLATPTGTADP